MSELTQSQIEKLKTTKSMLERINSSTVLLNNRDRGTSKVLSEASVAHRNVSEVLDEHTS